jgi:hypothetical protein
VLGRFEKTQVTDQIQLLIIIWISKYWNNYVNDISTQMVCKGLFVTDKKLTLSLISLAKGTEKG